jgi:invasion protein IalB
VKRIAFLLCLSLCAQPAWAQPRKLDVPRSEQTIGAWVIACATDPMTDARVCRMRHRLWLVVPNETQPGMAFEVQLRDGHPAPAVTVRDLSLTTALSGLLTLTTTAQLRFDGAAMAELPCALDGTSVVCAPTKADAASLAEQMAKARTVLVGIRAVGNLPLPVPDGPLVLDLDHTREALDRYRLAGPDVAPAQSSLTENLMLSIDQLLRQLGLPGMEGQPSRPK